MNEEGFELGPDGIPGEENDNNQISEGYSPNIRIT